MFFRNLLHQNKLLTKQLEIMALIKVVEIMANSGKSWEDAAQNAVKQAAKTIKNIKSIYVKEQTAVVNGENITEYRVNFKISFEVVH
jgi:dodecin